MNHRFPSLPALRVFEAAARHQSFTKAARELNVTQAAVSHQVRALEDQLGIPLFRRSTRRLTLTREGLRLQPAATEAFDILRQALTEIGREGRLLSITTTPSFGARWLAPRLARFAERHPEIDLSIRHTQTVLDLAAEGLDLGIRWGKGRWPGLESELIGPAIRYVVASPGYVRHLELKAPADVARATLLHDDTREDWTEWLLVAGLDPSLARHGIVIDDENALMQAALNGQGLAMASPSIAYADLQSGALVSPFELALADGYGFYLVYEKGALERPKVAAFRSFLKAETEREQGGRASLTIPGAVG
jgi:LysR family transcriptional regulator, glycine cleavage system transcriptional activator